MNQREFNLLVHVYRKLQRLRAEPVDVETLLTIDDCLTILDMLKVKAGE